MDRADADEQAVVCAEYGVGHPRPRATLAQVADHIEHVRTVAGIEHVGIGGDSTAPTTCPTGWRMSAAIPRWPPNFSTGDGTGTNASR